MNKRLALISLAACLHRLQGGADSPDATDWFGLNAVETLTVPLPLAVSPPASSFLRLPLSFVRNDGQADPATRFEVRGRGYSLSLEPTEAVMALAGRKAGGIGEDWRAPTPGDDSMPTFHLLRTSLVGANTDAAITGEDELPGKFHYFIGNDPARWRTNVPSFARVRYHEVYPGIDLVYYGNEGQLEYDFVVAPGADPDRIELAIEGADAVEVDTNGDLRLEVAGRELRWRRPVVLQERDGERIDVAGAYVLRPAPEDGDSAGVRHVAFRVAPYDRMLALVIDPVLAYSTYLGGGLSDGARAVAVDKDGCAYLTGFTWSSNNFPTTTNRIQRTFTVNGAAFVTKFNLTGDKLLYSTVLTGSDYIYGESGGYGIQVDAEGQAVVVGFTDQSDFPTRNALQPAYGGSYGDTQRGDVFIARLSPDGAALVFSTYLGGSGFEVPGSIALDVAGNIHVVGGTRGPDFPTFNAFQSEYGGDAWDMFVAKISPDGGRFIYSSFLGDEHLESYDSARLGLDSAGRCYVAWTTIEEVAENQWSRTAWLARVNSAGSALDFRKPDVLSGDGTIAGLAVDSSDRVYLAGYTSSTTLLTSPNAFQRTFAGGYSDVFVGKLNGETLSMDYLTYLGGAAGGEGAGSLAVDSAGHVYVVGNTQSADFPTVDPVQSSFRNGPASEHRDGFVTKLSPDGSRLVWSTFLGGGRAPSTGNGSDEAVGVALGADGAAYVVGATSSSDFPVQNAFQRTLRTESNWYARDAFIAKIAGVPPPSLGIARTGGTVTISWPVSAAGFGLESTDALAPSANWQPEPTLPEIVGEQNVVTLEAGAAARFFRLKKP
ncbi:MAG: SBBP repeat-containing protein [Verrucomicrobia bacterium]|nr:SBBP repeat-containing protein [Verrucomicrobiota bacterium]